MATTQLRSSGPGTVERNIALAGQVMRYLYVNPRILEKLPPHFELIILPEDDAELRLYNLELLDRHGSEGQPIVFARTRSHPGEADDRWLASFYIPAVA